MSSGNGHGQPPVELLENQFQPVFEVTMAAPRARKRPWVLALILFLLTILSTLAVGAQFAQAYAANQAPFASDVNPFEGIAAAFIHPELLLLGIPFAFALLAILLAHELGHYFACRYYGIDASYPYFIPAPTIIGTMGAFIRIRSRIINRTALFDVGISGPVIGFLFAVPALALAILYSKVVPGAQSDALIVFGNPLLVKLLVAILRPGISPNDLLLHPVGRAAWVGLFATALNLLPSGQLDGGHILRSVNPRAHRLLSFVLPIILVALGYFLHWSGWYVWAGLLSALLFLRKAPFYDDTPLDPPRKFGALLAFLIFLLCFMPAPILISQTV